MCERMKRNSMRYGTVLFVILTTILLWQSVVSAAPVVESPRVDYEAGTVTIQGTLGAGNSGMRVTFTVTDNEGGVVYLNQGTSGAGGSFQEVILLSKLFMGGTYTVSVHATEQAAPATAQFEVDRTQETIYAKEVGITGADQNGVIRDGELLTGTYTFFSGFGQDEGASKYSWYVSGSPESAGYAIPGASEKTYTLRTVDIQKVAEAYPDEFQEKKYLIRFGVEVQSLGAENFAPLAKSENAATALTAPVAAEVGISGTGKTGRALKGTYDYTNLTGKPEKGSVYRWLSSRSESGTYTSHAAGLSYTPNSADVGLYLKFEVTPVSADGVKGEAVISKSHVKVTDSSSGSGGGGGGRNPGGSPVGNTTVKGEVPDTVIAPNTPDSVPGEFEDVPPEHWAAEIIREMVLRGDASGVDENHFEPDRQITRAEFAKLVSNVMKLEKKTYRGEYLDVSGDDWFSGYVQTVTDSGLMSGFDGFFRPEEDITREEMAKVVAAAYLSTGAEPENGGQLSFTDRESISPWAQDAVLQASLLGIVTGLPDGSFQPQGEASRAEAAAMLNRLYHILKTEDAEA